MTLLRSLVTVGSFLAFLGIVFWAYSGRHRDYLEWQGRVVLEDESADNPPVRDHS